MVTKIGCMLLLVSAPLLLHAQELEFTTPKKLPAAVNSAGEEALPMLSPDGKQLFFTRALYDGNTGGKFSGLDVWSADVTPRGWDKPRNAFTHVNNEGHNALIGMSRDGNARYFLNVSTEEKMTGIYVTKRINQYWTRPEFVPVPGIVNEDFLGMFVSPDFDVILISMKAPDSRGDEDLYFSVRSSSGFWSVPKNMGATINTRGFEISPFLSADKRRLYFSSNGHGGEGDADVFYSDRLYNSWETWSVPVNLGKEVNSKKFDGYFSIYGDTIAYLASNRDGRFADLFEMKVSIRQTVLADGQRYLGNDELDRAVGKGVSRELGFVNGSAILSDSQKELLFYIANRLQLEKDIIFHLVAKKEEDAAVTTQRLNAISQYLMQSGIEATRVIIRQVERVSPAAGGLIEIRLIR